MAKKKKSTSRKIVAKLVSITLVIASIVILVNVGKKVYSVYLLNMQSEDVERELIALQDENATLVSTKTKLEDPSYVTTYARGEYMFSKGDEKVFYLPSSSEESNEETSD